MSKGYIIEFVLLSFCHPSAIRLHPFAFPSLYYPLSVFNSSGSLNIWVGYFLGRRLEQWLHWRKDRCSKFDFTQNFPSYRCSCRVEKKRPFLTFTLPKCFVIYQTEYNEIIFFQSKFSMTLMFWLVCWSVSLAVIISLKKGREVTLPCSSRRSRQSHCTLIVFRSQGLAAAGQIKSFLKTRITGTTF